MNKIIFALLRALEKQDGPVGSTELSKQLLSHGVELSERTVRYYLKMTDEKGFTQVQGKKGRIITESGKKELGHAFVSERINFVINKIDSLAFLTDFSLDALRGNIILNISFFHEKKLKDALRLMTDIFDSPYAMSNRIIIEKGGGRIGDVVVPRGTVGIGTICSITLNGIFLKAGIPVNSKYGGVAEVEDGSPKRFTSLISYEGSSVDPLEIFIKSGMTDVIGAIKQKSGKVLASFRELPVVSINEAEKLITKLGSKGIGGKIILGKPNQPLLDVPVGVDKVGMIVPGGLNPVAAVEESGISTESQAMSTLFEYSRLSGFNEAISSFIYQ